MYNIPLPWESLWYTDTVVIWQKSPDSAGHFIIVHLTVSGVFSAKGEFSHPDAKMKRSLGQN